MLLRYKISTRSEVAPAGAMGNINTAAACCGGPRSRSEESEAAAVEAAAEAAAVEAAAAAAAVEAAAQAAAQWHETRYQRWQEEQQHG